MFNLIVSGGVENDRQGSILASRMFQYTDDEIKAKFMLGSSIDTAALIRLPTIFMNEGKIYRNSEHR